MALFLINKSIIQKNFGTFLDNFKKTEKTDSTTRPNEGGPTSPAAPVSPEAPAPRAPAKPASTPTPSAQPASPPGTSSPASTTTTEKPAAAPQPEAREPARPRPGTTDAVKPAAELRKRTIWLVRLDSDGTLVRTRSERELQASDSPLKDSLNALLAGPLPVEKNKGLDTLIPQGTTLISVIVRGTTAYINLSEHFLFNTYGIEGYAAQLKQIIWTATEFPTVKDVQILIEGRRVDYLGSEGIFIGSPLSRGNL